MSLECYLDYNRMIKIVAGKCVLLQIPSPVWWKSHPSANMDLLPKPWCSSMDNSSSLMFYRMESEFIPCVSVFWVPHRAYSVWKTSVLLVRQTEPQSGPQRFILRTLLHGWQDISYQVSVRRLNITRMDGVAWFLLTLSTQQSKPSLNSTQCLLGDLTYSILALT